MGVVVIGGSEGGFESSSFQASVLAQAGHPSFGLGKHRVAGHPDTLLEIGLEYFASAVEWLSGQPAVNGVALVGASRGSEAALLTAVHFPDHLTGVVALVPGNVTLGSWPPGGPAWTVADQALPYVGWYGPGSDNPDAVIAVERIRAPLFLVGARLDETWPSAEMAEAIANRREDNHVPYDDELIIFPDAGHSLSILAPPRDGTSYPDADQRTIAWEALLLFLRTKFDRG